MFVRYLFMFFLGVSTYALLFWCIQYIPDSYVQRMKDRAIFIQALTMLVTASMPFIITYLVHHSITNATKHLSDKIDKIEDQQKADEK